jgi:Protein of unknown function (DUF4012)
LTAKSTSITIIYRILMKKYNFKPSNINHDRQPQTHWLQVFLGTNFVRFERWLVPRVYNIKQSIKTKSKPLINAFQKHWVISIILLLIIAVTGNYTLLNIKQSLRNIEQNKSSLLDKIKSIINKNDKEQIKILNEIETKLITDLEPIASNPIAGMVVKSDISKVKTIVAKWLDILYPFKNYKFGTDGFNSTLLQQRYFTQDVEIFLNKSKPLIEETRNILNSFWLYNIFGTNQVKESISAIESILDIVEIFNDKRDILLTMLGHYQTQKIVIFNQNNGEARPTGGFIGSYIPIDISRGQIKIGQSQSIYFFDKGPNTNLISHPTLWYYDYFNGKAGPHGARNSNVFPCFPDSAKYLEREFAKTENGYNIDDVLFLSPDYLLGYLPTDFELKIDNEFVPKNQLLNKIEQITAIEIEDKNNPKKQITSIFNLLIEQLPQILKGQALIDLIGYTQESLLARNAQAWFRNDKIQKLWETTGFAGTDTCQNLSQNQIITPIIINLSGDKRNLITSTNFEIIKINNTMKFKWQQTLPENKYDVLQRGFINEGITMVGFQIPADWKGKTTANSEILKVPFLRNYYNQQIEIENQTKYVYPQEITKLINSSYDISQNNLDKGFNYIQPDGSRVVGVYVHDRFDQDLKMVEFDIEINDKDSHPIIFYNQPNLNNSQLIYNQNIYQDKNTLQKGIKLD